jgi:hypothetical protein
MPTFINNTDSPITGTITDAQGRLQSIAVLPGASISVYTYSIPSGLTKNSDEPYFNPMSAQPAIVSLTAAGSTVSITAITKATNAQISATAHGLVTGDYCYIDTVVGGMVEIRDRIAQITKVSDDVFSCDNIDSTDFTTYTSGGTIRKVTPSLLAVDPDTDNLKVYGISQYTSSVRVHGQSPLNHPNLGDVIDQYDLILTGIRGRWTYLSLTEIAGIASTTVRVEQRK